jgi:hypothetical protein
MTSQSNAPIELRPSRSATVLRRWQPVLDDQVDDAATLVAQAQERVHEIAAKVAAPSEDVRGHLELSILPGAALYLESRARFGQSRALALARACFTASAERQSRPFHLLDRTPWLFPILRRWGRKLMQRSFSEPAFGMRWIEDSPQRVRFDMTRCLYLDTLTALGIPELTVEYCHGDEVLYGGLRHLEFVRAGTLAQGCATCDFCFQRRPGRDRRTVSGGTTTT